MKIRKVLLILIVLLLGGVVLVTTLKEKENSTKDSLAVISDADGYSDIKMFLENTKKQEGILFEIPQKASVQDYNTYYGNEILKLLDSVDVDLIMNYIDTAVSGENFLAYKEGDIFESIEKVYYLQKLADSVDEDYHNDKILEIVLSLIQTSYDEEGFFYYEEFDEYLTDMTETDIRTVRLYHTMMTLYLCKEYSLTDRLDIGAIQEYIEASVALNCDAVNCYYAYLSYVYMNINTDIFFDKEIYYDSNNLDIIELNAYVSLANELEVPIQSEIIGARMYAYVEECRMANMMELYIAIDTLDKLNEPVDDAWKDRIVSLLRMYQNEDGTFPCISYYILDNKQMLMHYEMTTRMGLEPDITQYKQWLVDDFDGQDYYDMYAYAYFASRLDMDTGNLEKKLISELGNCTLDNKSSIGYLLLALSELNIKADKYLNADVVSYVELISSSETMDYSAQDLILLYGALKSKIADVNDTMVNTIKNMDTDKIETMQALMTYYKYEILTLAEEKMDKKGEIIDKMELENDLLKLRCQGGFKMDEEDYFLDLQATYYLIKLVP